MLSSCPALGRICSLCFCPNKQHYFEPFRCLDLTLEVKNFAQSMEQEAGGVLGTDDDLRLQRASSSTVLLGEAAVLQATARPRALFLQAFLYSLQLVQVHSVWNWQQSALPSLVCWWFSQTHISIASGFSVRCSTSWDNPPLKFRKICCCYCCYFLFFLLAATAS